MGRYVVDAHLTDLLPVFIQSMFITHATEFTNLSHTDCNQQLGCDFMSLGTFTFVKVWCLKATLPNVNNCMVHFC